MSENKRYYWLKLKEDFFNQREIKKLRKIAGGDTFTIIYLKLMLHSLINDSNIYFEGTESDIFEQLSLELDEDLENIKLTFLFMMNNGLLEKVETDEYSLPYVRSCTGSETASTKRSRKSRDNKKALQCNTTATQLQHTATNCNTEKEKEKEKEKENRDKSKDKDICNSVVEKFNDVCVSLPKVAKVTDTRAKAIKARLAELNGDIAKLEEVFKLVEDSDFLSGRSGQWQANFDWVMKPANFVKILEGNYRNKKQAEKKKANCEISFDVGF